MNATTIQTGRQARVTVPEALLLLAGALGRSVINLWRREAFRLGLAIICGALGFVLNLADSRPGIALPVIIAALLITIHEAALDMAGKGGRK